MWVSLVAFSLLIAVLAYLLPRFRLWLASISIILMGFSVGTVFAQKPSIFSLVFLILSVFQIFNISRLIINRLHSRHMKKAFFIGGGRILLLQIASIGISYLPEGSYSFILDKIVWLQLAIGLVILLLVVTRLINSRPKNINSFMSDSELPTVSVLIPARNEDQNLINLLKGVVSNDYPKLEILVLDDCSTTGRISEIVKDFARDGVRFVEGNPPADNWLAKNQAYRDLVESSSGEWLLFMGVDVRLGSEVIRNLMNYAFNHNKTMLSILPRRYDGAYWGGFFSPLRYFRELLKIGRLKINVPCLSTAWLIKRDSYTALGGMESVAQKVIPEHYFANHLSTIKKYGFVRTNDHIQVSTAKTLREQLETSQRVIYPGLHKRMEWLAVSILAMFIFLFLPFLQLVNAFMQSNGSSVILYASICIALTVSHLLITTFTNPILWPLAAINFPYLVLQEIVLSFVSMYRYEFGKVIWKERNICLPVLQAIPRLPKLD